MQSLIEPTSSGLAMSWKQNHETNVDKSSNLASIVEGRTAAFRALTNALTGLNGCRSSNSRKAGMLSTRESSSLVYKWWKIIRRMPEMRPMKEATAANT